MRALIRRILLAPVLGLVIGAPGRAEAASVFSNLGPGDSYQGTVGFAIASGNSVGAAFIPTNTFTFSEAELALSLVSGPNSVTVQLRNEVVVGHPGNILESFTITDQMPPFGAFSSDHLVVANSVLHPTLNAGVEYWITVLPGNPATSAQWYPSEILSSGLVAASSDLGTTWPVVVVLQTLPAFRIDGELVPEPASFVMAGTGDLMVAVYVWCRHRRVAA
jgi:hypothetical protein